MVCANVSGLFVELSLLAIMESARRWSTKLHLHIDLSRKLEGKIRSSEGWKSVESRSDFQAHTVGVFSTPRN